MAQGAACDTPETKDPVTVHTPTRESVGYFEAVRIRDGNFASQREEGVFAGGSFFIFLKTVEVNKLSR